MFYPDEISTGYVMTEIAEKISKKVPVNVICGPANYETEVFTSKKPLASNIKIFRVKIPQFNKNKILGRILRMTYLTFKMGFVLLNKVKRGDRVILVTNPATLLLFVVLLKLLKKFHLTIIVHDVFPENVISAGLLKEKSFLYKMLKRLFDSTYRRADKLIVVGEDMGELIYIKTKKPSTVITNWADSDIVFPSAGLKRSFSNTYSTEDKIVIQFAGNIGRVQALDNFIKLFEKANNPNVILLIIGVGTMKPAIETYINNNKVNNVVILDALPREMQNSFLNSCDIGLVTLANGMFGLGVPSKCYNILAAGKPILYIGDNGSEISRYISRDKVGWTFDWEDENVVVNFIASLNVSNSEMINEYGTNSRRLVEGSFTKELILERYSTELLNDAS